jgi:hypothetical protein
MLSHTHHQTGVVVVRRVHRYVFSDDLAGAEGEYSIGSPSDPNASAGLAYSVSSCALESGVFTRIGVFGWCPRLEQPVRVLKLTLLDDHGINDELPSASVIATPGLEHKVLVLSFG